MKPATSSRITVVAQETGGMWRDWNETSSRGQMVFIDETELLRLSLMATITEPELDVERVILDDCGSAEMFLELLAELPGEFNADVLRIDNSGRGFLSATGRGGDRLLYALEPHDVRFYLFAHELLQRQSLEFLGRTA